MDSHDSHADLVARLRKRVKKLEDKVAELTARLEEKECH